MKKVLSVILALLMALSCLFVTASAAGSSSSSATSINLNTTYSDSITANATEDWYKFTISTSGTVTLNLEADFQYLMLYLYDSNKTDVWKNTYVTANSSGEISYSKELKLTSGTYYLAAKRYNSTSSSMGSYKFKLTFASASESFKETGFGSNNGFNTANSISLNTLYRGQIAVNDEKDYYKFTLSSSGSITLDFKSEMQYSKLYIYNSSKSEVWKNTYVSANSSGEISYSQKIDLSSGTYYLSVCQYNTYDYSMGNYTVKLSSSSNSGSGSGSSPVNLSVSSSSVSIKEGSSYKVTCSYTGGDGSGKTISYAIGNTNIVSCEWGDWNNKKCPITISGLSQGSTTVTIRLKNTATGEVLDTETINVTVTAENSGGNGGSGSGGGSSGGSDSSLADIIIDILLLPISLIFWLFDLLF